MLKTLKLLSQFKASQFITTKFTDKYSLINKVARFIVCEMIDGDYLEFGVYKGQQFVRSYWSIKTAFEARIALQIGGENQSDDAAKRRAIWARMRFVALDSFSGLPQLEKNDFASSDFKPGMYSFPENKFIREVQSYGVPKSKLLSVRGWFKDSCTYENFENNAIKKASVIWIDADLYSSTRDVLKGIQTLLQDGTVIVFDDWFSFGGSPHKGVQKAFSEWRNLNAIKSQFSFSEYHKDSWKRNSFITHKI